jgi:protein-disulfide isomerase
MAEAGEPMSVKSVLKLALGGALLFCGGAAATLLVTGRLPVTSALATMTGRAQIEQVIREYLLEHPDILVEMSTKLDRQQTASEDKQRTDALFDVGVKALFDPKVAYVEGPENAKVTVAEFFDYRCPHCKASLNAVKSLAAKNKDIRIAYIERPILTADSVLAARAAVASRRQPGKYVPFHYALMATVGELPKDRILEIAKTVGIDVAKLSKDMDDPAVIEQVNQSNALANQLHFVGTPTFVVNDQIIMGELTEDELQRMVDRLKG